MATYREQLANPDRLRLLVQSHEAELLERGCSYEDIQACKYRSAERYGDDVMNPQPETLYSMVASLGSLLGKYRKKDLMGFDKQNQTMKAALKAFVFKPPKPYLSPLELQALKKKRKMERRAKQEECRQRNLRVRVEKQQTRDNKAVSSYLTMLDREYYKKD